MSVRPLSEVVAGCLIGCAVGDALGLPFEGINARRLEKLKLLPLRHRLLLGRGMLSDDTEHICMTAQSLSRSGNDSNAFGRALAWELRKWFLSIPPATGLATLRACVKLIAGFPYTTSGIYSAGNGPAMRSPILGVLLSANNLQIAPYVGVCTRITHTDPKAYWGSLVVAFAAARAAEGELVKPRDFLQGVAVLGRTQGDAIGSFEELYRILELVCESVESGESTRQFAAAQGWGKGISGYIYQTVPAVIHAWLANQADFSRTIGSIIECGGDTDSTAAIAGALSGAQVGVQGIPAAWVDGVIDWPRSIDWIHRLSDATSASAYGSATVDTPGLFYPAVLLRNLFFLLVVLVHGFRRLLPPY